MNASQIIVVARRHVMHAASNETAAREHLYEAVRLVYKNDYEHARVAALKSLEYSVGPLHKDYVRCSK